MNPTTRRYPRTTLEAFPTSYPVAFEGHQPRKERFVYVLIRWMCYAIIVGLISAMYLGVI